MKAAIITVARGIPNNIIDRFVQFAKSPLADIIIIQGKNAGTFMLSRERNRAIKQAIAQGYDVIIQTDIDILIPPGLIEETISRVGNNQAVWAKCRRLSSRDLPYNLDNIRWDTWVKRPLRHMDYASWAAMLRSDWQLVGGYDERCWGYGGEDIVMHHKQRQLGIEIQVLDHFPLMHIDGPIYGGWDKKQHADGRNDNHKYCLQHPAPCNYLTTPLPTCEQIFIQICSMQAIEKLCLVFSESETKFSIVVCGKSSADHLHKSMQQLQSCDSIISVLTDNAKVAQQTGLKIWQYSFSGCIYPGIFIYDSFTYVCRGMLLQQNLSRGLYEPLGINPHYLLRGFRHGYRAICKNCPYHSASIHSQLVTGLRQYQMRVDDPRQTH